VIPRALLGLRSDWAFRSSLVTLATVTLLTGCERGDVTVTARNDSIEDRGPPGTGALLVAFEMISTGRRLWRLEVQDTGLCRGIVETGAGFRAFGIFQTQLDPSDLAAIRRALRSANRAKLRDVPQPTHGETESRCSITLREGEAIRTVSFPDIRVPGALRELYRLGRHPEPQDLGLLPEILEKVRGHPRSAIALRARTGKAVYRVADQVIVEVFLRSVGTHPVAVPSLQCQELAGGEVDILEARYYSSHAPNISEAVPFRCDRYLDGAHAVTFGPPPVRPFGHELTPEAQQDLTNVRVLEPGDEHQLTRLGPVPAEAEGMLELNVFVRILPMYSQQLVAGEVGAPFVTGTANALVRVRVWN
jgi:hypothetical protein